VVADTERGVGLNIVAGMQSELGPPIKEAGPAGDNCGDVGATNVGRRGERGGERLQRVVWFGIEHRGGWTLGREMHGTKFGHGRSVLATTEGDRTSSVTVMNSSVLALTTDNVKSYAIVAILAFIGIAIVAAMVVKAIVTKLLTMAICALLSLGMISQRSTVSKCVEDWKKDHKKTECSFFGVKVKIPLDQLQKS
jgi:hypothetical protein